MNIRRFITIEAGDSNEWQAELIQIQSPVDHKGTKTLQEWQMPLSRVESGSILLIRKVVVEAEGVAGGDERTEAIVEHG